MTVLSHKVTYQGLPVRAVQFRRTDGLSPESGYVDINIKDIGELAIGMPEILWRNQSGQMEVPGQMGIEQTTRLFSSQFKARGGTQSSGGKSSGGIGLYGDLVFETFSGGSSIGRIVYKDIYVAFEGIEEITEKLAHAKKHNEGFIRVPLSDIRQFYNDCGLLFQDINTRLRSGNYDPNSIKKDSAFGLDEIVKYLFSQLPGSPGLSGGDDLSSFGGNPPGEIIGQGEPVSGILQELLNQYGLIAKMQPDGSFGVFKKWISNAKPGTYSTAIGHSKTWPHLKTEKKSTNGTNRPCLVCVKGKRRVQRISLAYEPVIPWTDGRYYHLYDIGILTSGRYSIQDVNLQVLNNESKNFQDIYAKAPTLAEGDIWVQILRKWAYKMYAPAAALKSSTSSFGLNGTQGKASVASGGPALGKNIRVLMDEDEEFIPFLPATDAPWYRGELGLEGLAKLFKGKASQKNSGGDFDGVILLPPMVKARGIGERLFTDASEIVNFLNRVKASYQQEKDHIQSKVNVAQDRVSELTSQLNSAEVEADVALRKAGIESNPKPDVEPQDEGNIGRIKAGLKNLANKLGGHFATSGDINRYLDEWANNQVIKVTLEQAKLDLAAWQDQLKQSTKILEDILGGKIAAYANAYNTYRGFMGVGNLPTKILETGYSFHPREGIVTFNEPMCVGSAPLVMTSEGNRVIADGGVSVTFGYEYRYNNISDWTTVYVAPKGGGGGKASTAAVVGFSRPAAIKAKLERMPDLTMYLDEYGRPMNLTFVADAALRKAQFQVSQPDSVVGYHSIYHGFVPCVLDSGINSVMHSWAGGKTAAYTEIFQNYPGGNGPLGMAMTPSQGAAEMRAKARAAMRELENR